WRAGSGMTGWISSWADSAVEHLAQPGGERVRVAGLAVLPAQEAAVVAREPRRLNPDGSGDSHRGALRDETVRLGAVRQDYPGLGSLDRVVVGLVSGGVNNVA